MVQGQLKSALDRALVIAVVIIGAVLAISVLADLAPTAFDSVADLVGVFTDENATLNDSIADAILPIFGTLLAIGFLVGIVTLAIRVVNVGRRGGDGF